MTKSLGAEGVNAVVAAAGAKTGDAILMIGGKWDVVCNALGQVRLEIGRREKLINENEYRLLWVVDFPMFEYHEDDKRWYAMHHPFTSPVDEDLDKLESDPGSVRAKAYDLVFNGNELGGGSIRIHRSDVQSKIFKALGLSEEEARERFGFFLDALSYGTPPHGGIALGLDRTVMLFAKAKSLRDVIAFPKVASCSDLMTDSPSAVAPGTVGGFENQDAGLRKAGRKMGAEKDIRRIALKILSLVLLVLPLLTDIFNRSRLLATLQELSVVLEDCS